MDGSIVVSASTHSRLSFRSAQHNHCCQRASIFTIAYLTVTASLSKSNTGTAFTFRRCRRPCPCAGPCR